MIKVVVDENIPFVLRGLGSKRLLSMGMNINAFRCYFKNIAKSAQSAKYIRIFIDGQEYIP